jgi:transcriptional regulator with XRE-family HTH domain
MNAINNDLREDLKDPEIAEGYAESFLDSYIATQIKVLREQNNLSQAELATLIGTKQGAISRIEDVNYSKWNVTTLKKLARAFRVRLRVSFETYGSLIQEVEAFSRPSLQRTPRENDPILFSTQCAPVALRHRNLADSATHIHLSFPSGNNNAGQLQHQLMGHQQSFLLQFQRRPQMAHAASAENSIMEAVG